MEELIDALTDCKALRFGEFILSSGAKSHYYVDIKYASTHPRVLSLIAEKIVQVIEENNIKADCIGGVAIGGIPLATATSLRLKKPLLIIRKEVKNYGTGGRIIGDVREGVRVLLIEDVVTTAGSVLEAIRVIRGEGGVVEDVIAVVDREEGGREKLQQHNVKLHALTTASEFKK
jgi:orotate phosphoribosyltransferase